MLLAASAHVFARTVVVWLAVTPWQQVTPCALALSVTSVETTGSGPSAPPGRQNESIVITDEEEVVHEEEVQQQVTSWGQQLKALEELWKSLDCTKKSWPEAERDKCPSWALCQNGNVLRIRLSSSGCRGKLPADGWAALRGLISIQLHSNDLHGDLPPQLGELPLLRYVALQHNRLTGHLPRAWGKLRRARWMCLHSNGLSGPLPSSWSNMKNLRSLNLQNNTLNESLPADWGSMTALSSLTLQDNRLSGSLPPEWGMLPRLRALKLHHNNLNGTFPAEWTNLNALEMLDLHFNCLKGQLPGHLPKKLSHLHLGQNKFSGELPEAWGHQASLRMLQLGSNQLRGMFPRAWCNLSGLQLLQLDNNKLHGEIPRHCWTNSPSMKTLLLHDNRFSGALPELSHVANYRAVLMHGNHFAGPISKLGMPKMDLLLALPGNYLLPPADADATRYEAEPFVDASGSALFRSDRCSWKLLALILAGLLTWAMIYTRMPEASLPTAVSMADAALQQHFVALGPSVLIQAGVAAALAVLYTAFASKSVGIMDASTPTVAFVAGNAVAFAFLCIPLATSWLLPLFLSLPHRASPTGHVEWKSRRSVGGWMCMLVVCLISSGPAFARMYAQSIPAQYLGRQLTYGEENRRLEPAWVHSLEKLLPAVSAGFDAVVLPALLSRVASLTNAPLNKLQTIQGASSWALPLATVVALSPDCYGLLRLRRQRRSSLHRYCTRLDATERAKALLHFSYLLSSSVLIRSSGSSRVFNTCAPPASWSSQGRLSS
eukprot:TRINITY_DN25871_c0_g1_i1.p1 TRINITY_DN25871_c0_g1~~TRINITY_DN25871_c0_g1_i1.p1  ORF type:complete len:774 (-),score=90.32 TRINITY_DN25871_c0_g1_i1:32-2353(-)